jgi:3-oxoacyl-[acyl-carrier-protein] synthase-3
MSYLRAFGSWLPLHRMTNAVLAPLVDATPEWILEVTGILERRYAAAEDTVASLALRAAHSCIENAGISAADLGLILVASGSSDRFCPGPASQVAAALGLASTPALDIPVTSAGTLIGLAMAAQMATAVGRVLVIGAEIMSRRVSLTPEGKNTAILFGDGGGACLVDPDAGFSRIADWRLYTDGATGEILAMEDGRFRMDGPQVILQAARKIPRSISELLTRNQIAPEAVTAYILHQANLNLITRVASSVKAPRERFFTNIECYGNTSSASMLIAADEWWGRQAGSLHGPIVFSAFGSGINWGALLALPA